MAAFRALSPPDATFDASIHLAGFRGHPPLPKRKEGKKANAGRTNYSEGEKKRIRETERRHTRLVLVLLASSVLF